MSTENKGKTLELHKKALITVLSLLRVWLALTASALFFIYLMKMSLVIGLTTLTIAFLVAFYLAAYSDAKASAKRNNKK